MPRQPKSPSTPRSARSRPASPKKVPQINRLGSIQAFYELRRRAQTLRIDFGGHPTGVFQKRDKLFLYEDIGVGCVKARIVRRVRPLNAWDYLPRTA